jgi:hypothetical protein
LHDSDALLAGARRPRALVVAWDSEGEPASSDVIVGSQHSVGDAIERVLKDWDRAGRFPSSA